MLKTLKYPYYMGVVQYRGVHYLGSHPPMIDPATWLATQDVIAAHAHAGERDRKHPHYLRGTIFCSSCGARLDYSRNTGSGGTYEYFLCVKRKNRANSCQRPAVRIERNEDGVSRYYASFHVTPHRVREIQEQVHAELASQRKDAADRSRRAERCKAKLQDERLKLLQAVYAGAIPDNLLVSEMQRLTKALADADLEIAAANAMSDEIESLLDAALAAAAKAPQHYDSAAPAIRRQINQGFFRKLFIGEVGSVAHAELNEPFAALLTAPGG